MYMALYTLIMA